MDSNNSLSKEFHVVDDMDMDVTDAGNEQEDDEEDTWWYVCLICHQAFTQEIQLRHHRKVNHTLTGPKSFLVLSQKYDLLPSINLNRSESSRHSVGLVQRQPSPSKKCMQNKDNYTGNEPVLHENADMPLEEADLKTKEIILEINNCGTPSIVPRKGDRKKRARKLSTSKKKKRSRKSKTKTKNESSHFQCKLCFSMFSTTGRLNSHVLIKHIPNEETNSDQAVGVDNLKSEIKLENTHIHASVQNDNSSTLTETNIEYSAQSSNNFEAVPAVRIEEHVNLDNDGNIVLPDKLKTDFSPVKLLTGTEKSIIETICTKSVSPPLQRLRPRKRGLNIYSEENDGDDLPINDDSPIIETEIESSSVSSDSEFEENPVRKRTSAKGQITRNSERKKNEIQTITHTKNTNKVPITSLTKSIHTRNNGEILYECKFCCCKYVNERRLKLHVEDIHPDQYEAIELCSADVTKDRSQSEKYEISLYGSEMGLSCLLTTESVPQTTGDPYKDVSGQIQAAREDESNSTTDTNIEPEQNADSIPNSVKESFDCGICDKLFDKLDDMNQHILEIHRDHINNSNLELACDCIHCFKVFLIPLSSTLSYGGYKCKICHEFLIRKSYVKLHILRNHTIEEILDVDPSKKDWFSKLQSVRGPYFRGQRKTIANPTLACKKCNLKFVHQTYLNQHLESCKDDSNNDKRNERFTCTICHTQYLCLKTLRIHQSTVHAPNTQEFTCTECGMKFNCSAYLKGHFYRCHDGRLDKVFECDICGRPFNTLKKVKYHRTSHNSVKPYLCSKCGSAHKTKKYLGTHMRTYHSIGNFKCHQCDQCFTTKGRLDRHSGIHSEDRPFKCSICGNSFKIEIDLKNHQKRSHSAKPKFKACRICNQEFPGQISLKRHLLEFHNEELSTKHECEVCGKKFPAPFNLKVHMHLHSDLKTIECPTCGKMFKTKTNLRQHLTTHLTQDEMKYQCDVCGKKFPLGGTLRVHELSHSREPNNKNKITSSSKKKKTEENCGEKQDE